ncbi:GNAT family N-acetyltransferase [Proteinivorax tanatarense]|uniref:GNAT family N-acetyltransferase n=1 Tax=Proteinivorax tanatarense TaxID=1260629 RepID=A0AAU7VQQ5_9FIRM
MAILIKAINSCEPINDMVIEKMAMVYCYEEPGQIESVKEYWSNWLTGENEGDKLTVVAEDIKEQCLAGVVRFWKTPHCGNKWLIEGLEVIKPKRKSGLGKSMVEYGLNFLKSKGVDKISANISSKNVASIKLHESLGFKKISSGAINSYGDFRPYMDEYQLVLASLWDNEVS